MVIIALIGFFAWHVEKYAKSFETNISGSSPENPEDLLSHASTFET